MIAVGSVWLSLFQGFKSKYCFISVYNSCQSISILLILHLKKKHVPVVNCCVMFQVDKWEDLEVLSLPQWILLHCSWDSFD